MASSADKNPASAPKKKGSQPSGVRGPGGPPPAQPRSGSRATSSARATSGQPSAQRSALERRSYPLLRVLQRVPKWLIVVLPAILLFFGLIQTGGLAWLGGVLLLLVAVFLGWLLLLSWPALSPGSRTVRIVTVAAVVGIALLKFLGRF